MDELKKIRIDGDKDALISVLAGMSQFEAYRAMKQCALENNGVLKPQWIAQVKNRMIMERFKGALSIENTDTVDVGGNEYLMEWAGIRKSNFFSPRSRLMNVIPKGVIAVGFPGTGKSLTAKVLARQWGIPLVKVSFALVFDKFVGETERKLKEVFETLELLSPCIAWFDEIEKAIASGGTGENDGGVSNRAFGMLLEWMQEKKSPVFIFATANNINGLRPELKRKGRFDEIFFIDTPNRADRVAIVKLHCGYGMRGTMLDKVDAEAVADVTEGYCGAELEAVLVEAITVAIAKDAEKVSTEDVLAVIKRTTPLVKIEPNLLPALKSWAKETGAVRANKDEDNANPQGAKGGFDRTTEFSKSYDLENLEKPKEKGDE